MKVAVAVTEAMVKAECERRITAPDAYPIHRQLNIQRASTAEWVEMDAFINRHRAASKRLREMNPIPGDFRADHHWSDE